MDSIYSSRESLLERSPASDQNDEKKVSFLQLFRFSTKFQRLLIVFGLVIAAAVGMMRPILGTLTGKIMQTFVNFTRDIAPLNATDPRREIIYNQFHDQAMQACYLFFFLAIFSFVTGFAVNMCFLYISDNMTIQLRKKFIEALLRQDVAWFDSQKTGALTTQLFSDLERVKEGTGDHIGYGMYMLSLLVGGTILSLYFNWKLTLITMALTPVNIVFSWYQNKKLTSLAAKQSKVDGEAGAVCEQALTSMRTVLYFNGQKQEISRYSEVLKRFDKIGIRHALCTGIWYCFQQMLVFPSLGLCIWAGSRLFYYGEIDSAAIISVYMIMNYTLIRMVWLGPIFTKINRAQAGAQSVYAIIDRVPEIDSYSTEGSRPPVEGRITVQNLRFTYPTRKEVQVLKDITFSVEPGQTVALVGSSGSGKSTIVQLLLRFYDPTGGRILIDGMEIDEFNIQYLRETIGVVSQEPILFNTTIEENIRYGRENITEPQIWTALRKANAYDFVKAFPKGLQTLVGDRGAQLSGGQKQRIAIARALVRDPRILLLDEATSALDSESERIVQDALENASKGRTTLVIAHRLSTIRNADRIIAMKHGEIQETGTHQELLDRRGLYYDLVNNQVFVDTHDTETKPEYRWSRSISSEAGPEHRRLRLSSRDAIGQEEGDVMEDETMKRLKEELLEEDAKPASIWRIIKEARPQWKHLAICLVACLLEGVIFPLMAFGFTELVRIFSGPKEEILSEGNLMLYIFVGMGVYYGLTQLTHTSLFGVISEKLASRLRLKVYKNLMRQDGAYFDKPLHSPGRLLTRLGSDGNNMKPALNSRLGMIFSELSMDILGNAASIYFCWQMAIVAMPIWPISYLSWVLCERFVRQKTLQDEKEMEECGKIAMEAATNIRTVHSLNLQKKVYGKFCSHLNKTMATNLKKDLLQSFCYGLAQAMMSLNYGICYLAGIYFVYHNIADPQMILRSIFITGWASCSLGSISQYLPDYIKAKMAAGLLFKMMDQEPEIDGMSTTGSRPDFEGNITVKNLQFSYPERQDVQVLKGIDLDMKQGEAVALVGASGCGKSTIVSLLERLYNADNGSIEIDGNNVRAINTQHIRSNISIVSQEPVLFDLTIKENIMYGLAENSVSHVEMVEAAKKANIHDFISCLPEAYQTRVGDKGTQLSGGQKQRIAIARALVRKPKILILDEATSALDTESEKHVQLALDQAKAGRSCLVIAHRLSTIVNSDLIVVFKEGKVVEKGTHDELLARKGVYYSLIQKQSSSRSLE